MLLVGLCVAGCPLSKIVLLIGIFPLSQFASILCCRSMGQTFQERVFVASSSTRFYRLVGVRFPLLHPRIRSTQVYPRELTPLRFRTAV